MYPELFRLSFPEFLSQLFGVSYISIYTYACLIAFGTFIAVIYVKYTAHKELGITKLSNSFFYTIFLAGFIGGKLFYYLQNPLDYIENPQLILDNISGGFVFYGSFVTIIPFIIWYLKRQQLPVLPMLDIFAITTTIIHAIGRLGCFAAGCCYGAHTQSRFGVTFPNTHGISVHATQLYEASMLLVLMCFLLVLKRKKQFQGQVFLIYMMLYALGRAILEFFRGDDRGFVIKDILSHSQLIALCLMTVAVYIYYKLYKQLNIHTINT
jgi:phosphatidylglycerol:prolipoprotein diacylglycerol transferase